MRFNRTALPASMTLLFLLTLGFPSKGAVLQVGEKSIFSVQIEDLVIKQNESSDAINITAQIGRLISQALRLRIHFFQKKAGIRLRTATNEGDIDFKISGEIQSIPTVIGKVRIKINLTEPVRDGEPRQQKILDTYLVPADEDFFYEILRLTDDITAIIEGRIKSNTMRKHMLVACFSAINTDDNNRRQVSDEQLAVNATEIFSYEIYTKFEKERTIKTSFLENMSACGTSEQAKKALNHAIKKTDPDLIISAEIEIKKDMVTIYPRIRILAKKNITPKQFSVNLFSVETKLDVLLGGTVDEALVDQIAMVLKPALEKNSVWNDWLEQIELISKEEKLDKAVLNSRTLLSKKAFSLAEYVSLHVKVRSAEEPIERRNLATANLTLGQIYLKKENLDKALIHLSEAAELYEELSLPSEPNPLAFEQTNLNNSEVSSFLLLSRLLIADVQYRLRKYSSAVVAYTEALKPFHVITAQENGGFSLPIKPGKKVPKYLVEFVDRYAWASYESEQYDNAASAYKKLINSNFRIGQSAQNLLTALVKGEKLSDAQSAFDELMKNVLREFSEEEREEIKQSYIYELRLEARKQVKDEDNPDLIPNYPRYIEYHKIIDSREKSALSAFDLANAYSFSFFYSTDGKNQKSAFPKILSKLEEFILLSKEELKKLKLEEIDDYIDLEHSVTTDWLMTEKKDNLAKFISRFYLGRIFRLEIQIYSDVETDFDDTFDFDKKKIDELALLVMKQEKYQSLKSFELYFRTISLAIGGQASERQFEESLKKIKMLPAPKDKNYIWNWRTMISYLENKKPLNEQMKTTVQLLKEIP